jgi:inhibitor of cysteine peptidase
LSEIVVREGQNAGAVNLARGDVLIVELAENPTTGFRWQVAAVDSGALRLRSDEFAPDPGAAPGSGGLRVLRWEAVNPGDIEVRLELRRAWETDAPRSAFTIRARIA